MRFIVGESDPPVSTHWATVIDRARNGSAASARSAWQRAFAQGFGLPQDVSAAIDAAIILGDVALLERLKDHDDCFTAAAPDLETYMELAGMIARHGRYVDALQMVDDCTTDQKEQAVWLAWSMDLAACIRRTTTCVRNHELLISFATPEELAPHLAYIAGAALSGVQEPALALPWLRAAHRKAPGSATVVLALADALRASGLADDADSLLRTWSGRHRVVLPAERARLAFLAFSQRDWPTTKSHCEALLEHFSQREADLIVDDGDHTESDDRPTDAPLDNADYLETPHLDAIRSALMVALLNLGRQDEAAALAEERPEGSIWPRIVANFAPEAEQIRLPIRPSIQQRDMCAAYSTCMALELLGEHIEPAQAYAEMARSTGVATSELQHWLNERGFSLIAIGIDAESACEWLRAGHALLASTSSLVSAHMVVVSGYDARIECFEVTDPANGQVGLVHRDSIKTFDSFGHDGFWTIVRQDSPPAVLVQRARQAPRGQLHRARNLLELGDLAGATTIVEECDDTRAAMLFRFEHRGSLCTLQEAHEIAESLMGELDQFSSIVVLGLKAFLADRLGTPSGPDAPPECMDGVGLKFDLDRTFAEHRWERAAAITRFLIQHAQAEWAWTLHSVACRRLGQETEADWALGIATEVSPRDPNVHAERMKRVVLQRELSDEEWHDTVSILVGRDYEPGAVHQLATIAFCIGRLSSIEPLVEQAVLRHPHAPSARELSNYYYSQIMERPDLDTLADGSEDISGKPHAEDALADESAASLLQKPQCANQTCRQDSEFDALLQRLQTGATESDLTSAVADARAWLAYRHDLGWELALRRELIGALTQTNNFRDVRSMEFLEALPSRLPEPRYETAAAFTAGLYVPSNVRELSTALKQWNLQNGRGHTGTAAVRRALVKAELIGGAHRRARIRSKALTAEFDLTRDWLDMSKVALASGFPTGSREILECVQKRQPWNRVNLNALRARLIDEGKWAEVCDVACRLVELHPRHVGCAATAWGDLVEGYGFERADAWLSSRKRYYPDQMLVYARVSQLRMDHPECLHTTGALRFFCDHYGDAGLRTAARCFLEGLAVFGPPPQWLAERIARLPDSSPLKFRWNTMFGSEGLNHTFFTDYLVQNGSFHDFVEYLQRLPRASQETAAIELFRSFRAEVGVHLLRAGDFLQALVDAGLENSALSLGEYLLQEFPQWNGLKALVARLFSSLQRTPNVETLDALGNWHGLSWTYVPLVATQLVDARMLSGVFLMLDCAAATGDLALALKARASVNTETWTTEHQELLVDLIQEQDDNPEAFVLAAHNRWLSDDELMQLAQRMLAAPPLAGSARFLVVAARIAQRCSRPLPVMWESWACQAVGYAPIDSDAAAPTDDRIELLALLCEWCAVRRSTWRAEHWVHTSWIQRLYYRVRYRWLARPAWIPAPTPRAQQRLPEINAETSLALVKS